MSNADFDATALGNALRRYREARGWTSHRLAVRAGVADPYVARIERGDGAGIGVAIVAKLVSALGITLEDLLGPAGLPVSGPIAKDLDGIYRELEPSFRHALVRNARTLRDLQSEYAAMQAEYSTRDLTEARRADNPEQTELELERDAPEEATQGEEVFREDAAYSESEIEQAAKEDVDQYLGPDEEPPE